MKNLTKFVTISSLISSLIFLTACSLTARSDKEGPNSLKESKRVDFHVGTLPSQGNEK